MIFDRLRLNIGQEALENLYTKTVLIVGIGGVGSYACEAIARCGIGKIIIVDKDIVDITNINRQLIALHSTVGKSKVEIMKERIVDINPKCEVVAVHKFFDNEMLDIFQSNQIDFVIDACDTISAKYTIIEYCLNNNINFISSMGAANKVDPTKFKICLLDKTSYDPLARVLRRKVKYNGLKGKIPVVFSTEEQKKSINEVRLGKTRKEVHPPSSNAFTPSVCGLICASFVINSIVEGEYYFS